MNRIYQVHLERAGKGKGVEEIGRVMERDFFMSAQEAMEWGIVDKILERRDAQGERGK